MASGYHDFGETRGESWLEGSLCLLSSQESVV